jgi:hypothetical protein
MYDNKHIHAKQVQTLTRHGNTKHMKDFSN